MPVWLEPISLLEVLEAQGIKPAVLHYQMLMQCLTITGQRVAGFALLVLVKLVQELSVVVLRQPLLVLLVCRRNTDAMFAILTYVLLRATVY